VVPIGAESAFIEISQAIGPIDGGNLPGTVLIDDLQLSVISAIPEPSSCALLAGIGMAVMIRRRRA
jgi:hypothetical protein